MLDFFEQQARARRRTTLLVTLYVAGVCVFVLVVAPVLMAMATIVAGVIGGRSRRNGGGGNEELASLFQTLLHDPLATFQSPLGMKMWCVVTVGTLLLVFGASAVKAMSLRHGGGRMVAESLGGKLVPAGTRDFHEQRLRNVVEEMAIASGSPVPPVYVLDDERGINAFAAGFTTSDAVIGVTRGAAEGFTREQLQGVIGHEFSHILGGDMRLNIRLIGLLHGIIAVQLLGRVLFHIARATGRGGGRNSGKVAAAFLLFGAILMLLGLTGALLARMIKAMISRECEYRADAASAQFTRNPAGLAGALRVVGGTYGNGIVKSPQAEEYSHMYFVEGVSGWLASMLATHPPLPRRIKRLDPSWDGSWMRAPVQTRPGVDGLEVQGAAGLVGMPPGYAPAPTPAGVPQARTLTIDQATKHVGALTPEEVFARVGAARSLLHTIPPRVGAAAHDPHDARALVLGMLMSGPGETRAVQVEHIARHIGRGTADAAADMADVLAGLGSGVRLPLLDVALGALASLSEEQYRQFRSAVEDAITADGRTTLFETCVQRLLVVHLDRRFGMAAPPAVQYYALTRLGEEVSVLLSAVVYVSGRERSDGAADVGRMALELGARASRLLEAREITSARLHGALAALATAAARLRVKVVHACAEIIGVDGRVTPGEAELLRAIADSLDVPIALPMRQ